ncbi:protein mono-ADP-ribosyltransferase PARP15-like isoform X2 [Littorina saxatilis]|uniref:Poly [ADP-ribose] polymerase n=1 Tax=Littorina saxatilis TaxID=31220 RepID=A0AAN9AL96_9CAEN
MDRSQPETDEGGTDCVSCRKHIEVVCPHCDIRQPRLFTNRVSMLKEKHISAVKEGAHANVKQKPAKETSDDVLILKTDWSEKSPPPTSKTEAVSSSVQRPKVEAKPEHKELMITRLIDSHTETLLSEVMAQIKVHNSLPKEIVQKLYERFRLRLLGVTKRLEFLMEVDSQDVERVLNLQPEVQKLLSEVVPPGKREEVTWKDFSHHPLPCTDDTPRQQPDAFQKQGAGSENTCKQSAHQDEAPSYPRVSLRCVNDLEFVEEIFLVLPSNPQLDLSKGTLSRAILKEKGNRLQEQCRQKYPKGIQYGDIAVTGRGSNWGIPHVENILHCCLPDAQEKVKLKRAVWEVVTKSFGVADNLANRRWSEHVSMWLPALDFVNNRRLAPVVAEAMYHAVVDYGNQHPNTQIGDVCITLPMEDNEIIQIFMAEDERYRQAQMARIARETEERDRLPKPSVEEAESRADGPFSECLHSPDYELVRKLSHTSQEYEEVKDEFMATILMDTNLRPKTDHSDLIEIVTIERIDNSPLSAQYRNRRMHMGFDTEKKPLWHGTNENAADKIVKFGFSKRFCKRPKFGEAVYFARTANYASAHKFAKRNARGERIVFYCSVLVGRCVQARDGLQFPSTRQETEVQADFDCVVDDLNHPSIFAVYKDSQAYPEYKIVFKDR